jgi:hypothetical protein
MVFDCLACGRSLSYERAVDGYRLAIDPPKSDVIHLLDPEFSFRYFDGDRWRYGREKFWNYETWLHPLEIS